MKLISFLTLLLSFNQSWCQSLYISLPVEITPSNTEGGTRPRIALLHDSIPVVVHSKAGADPAVYFSKWNGASFTSTRLTSPGSLPLSSFINGPEIATSGDTVYVVIADHTDSASIILFRSFDGGTSFNDSILVADYSANHVEFPGITILPNGNLIISFMLASLDLSFTEMVTCISTDAGTTFSSPQNVSGLNPGKPCECCPNSLISSGNTVALAYRNNDSNIRDFYAVISSDGGQNYIGQRIDTSNWFNGSCPSNGADLLLSGDSLYWAFCAMRDGFMRVQNGGVSVSNPQITGSSKADSSSVNTTQSQAAIAGNQDTMLVFWQDNRLGSVDVYLSWRVQPGEPFTGPVRVNYSSTGTQRTPDAVYDGEMFHVVYHDYTAGKAFYNRISFNEFTSVGDHQAEAQPLLYPNPAKDHIQAISTGSNEISFISIYDLEGRLISGISNAARSRMFYIGFLTPGLYLLDITYTDGSRSVSRLTKL